MTYDFTNRPNRLIQHSVKWQATEKDTELLQAWVADMDFEPVPEIRQAIRDYADQHIFGYNYASDSLYQSILAWEASQHGYKVDREAIVLVEGVVPAISIAIQALTEEGDSILINTPVYPPFARSVRLNHRKLVTNSLIKQDGQFTLDFDQLEKDLIENEVKLYILCNPHNPGGRVWKKAELERIGSLCQQHGVILISDEIHQDLTLFGNQHHSFNTVNPSFREFSLILSSATKTFNIAGTKNSFAIIENPILRKKFIKRQLTNNQHEIATIGLITTEVAFRYGKPWLDSLKPVLETNIDYLVDYLEQHTKIEVMKPQGTYLVWLDFSAYGLSHEAVFDKLVTEAKVVLNDGQTFGKEGLYHARLNAATPLTTIQEICHRIAYSFGK